VRSYCAKIIAHTAHKRNPSRNHLTTISDPSGAQWFTDLPTLDKIKALIRANPRTTQGEMAKACGLSRTSIANWIKKSRGSIRRVGFDNGGFWQVEE